MSASIRQKLDALREQINARQRRQASAVDLVGWIMSKGGPRMLVKARALVRGTLSAAEFSDAMARRKAELVLRRRGRQ